MKRERIFSHIILLGAVTLCVHACTAPPMDDPISAMTDTEASYGTRRAAARQAFMMDKDNPAFTAALHKIIFSPGYPAWQRIDAVDKWVETDEQDLRNTLRVHIMSVPEWETLEHIFDVAIQRQWTDFLALAVRLYARPDNAYEDLQRPERRVIAALRPHQSVEASIFEVFANAAARDGGGSLVEQAAAWDLLWRLSDEPSIRAMLADAAPTNLVKDLHAARDDLGVLPRSREELLWLMTLREPGRLDRWNQLAARIDLLRDDQKIGLELRHLRVLMEFNEDMIGAERSLLIAEIGSRIGNAERHFKKPDDRRTQTFTANVNRMTWPDLATLYLLVDALSSPDVAAGFFRQAEADLHDTSTEYGGVLDRFMQQYTCNLYKPVLKRGDDVFVPSQSMVNHAYTGLFHYHFHAQSYDNGEHAGPGSGDLDVASRMGFNYVVFTFIDENRLNADYYQPDGTIIDLGTVYRPKTGPDDEQPDDDDNRFRAVEVRPFGDRLRETFED